MSRLVAFAAIQGGYKVVSQVEGDLEKALQTYDASTKIGFHGSSNSAAIDRCTDKRRKPAGHKPI